MTSLQAEAQSATSLAKDSLLLARHHLVDDQRPLARTWCARHLHEALRQAAAITPAGSAPERAQRLARLCDALGGADEPHTPDAATLHTVALELEAELVSSTPSRFGSAHAARIARDLGVVFITIIAVAVMMRVQKGRPLNLWSDAVSTSDFRVESSTQGWGKLEVDKTAGGVPIVIAGKAYEKGLGTHADGVIELIKTKNKGGRATGSCGYPDSAKGGRIVCSILGDGKELFRSGELSSSKPLAPFSVKIPANKRLTLKVEAPGGDINAAHAVWVNLRAE